MRQLLKITNALSDENRLKILFALQYGEMCVCQITELLRLATSTVSKHLFILKNAGLVDSRKTERWVYYSLRTREDNPLMRSALKWVLNEINKSEVSEKLAREVQRVLKLDIQDLCKTRKKDRRCSSSARGTRAGVTLPKAF